MTTDGMTKAQLLGALTNALVERDRARAMLEAEQSAHGCTRMHMNAAMLDLTRIYRATLALRELLRADEASLDAIDAIVDLIHDESWHHVPANRKRAHDEWEARHGNKV